MKSFSMLRTDTLIIQNCVVHLFKRGDSPHFNISCGVVASEEHQNMYHQGFTQPHTFIYVYACLLYCQGFSKHPIKTVAH